VTVSSGTPAKADFGNGQCSCPDCCDSFPKSLIGLTEQNNGGGVRQISGTVQAGSIKVCTVTATLLEARLNGTAVAGTFVTGGNIPAGVTGTNTYDHEVVWTGSATNVANGPTPFQQQIQFPQTPGTLEHCVRLSFTDKDCVTCDTVICFSVTNGLQFNGGDPELSNSADNPILTPVSGETIRRDKAVRDSVTTPDVER